MSAIITDPGDIIDQINNINYRRGSLLENGCYKFTDLKTKLTHASKIVSKQPLIKQKQKEQLTLEIAKHRALRHKHIHASYNFFEDEHNLYIISELRRGYSLQDMLNKRTVITEQETRFYLKQIVLACQYLHDNNIVHRGLSPENIFIENNTTLKVGDTFYLHVIYF
jgi:polo-like kinase 1